ncbi:Serine/threonine-protein kinase GRIK2, partial [Cucurbita argyrosperma subsp. argyrosperma]
MYKKSFSIAKMMGCCGCFGFTKKPKRLLRPASGFNRLSEDFLLGEDMEDEESCSSQDDMASTTHEEETDTHCRVKNSEEILRHRTQNGLICRHFPVKETNTVIRSENPLFIIVERPDENGNKTVNEYVRECKIGSGSYGKVVLYRSRVDGKYYAIKAFHKSHLSKLRVAPSETAMTDVLREVLIMKMLKHPNIVNLFEVIDDPDDDRFYMVLEYVEGKWACEGSDPPRGLDENTARKYLRDIVSGLMYLHAHNIVHGDIKPDNLLITRDGTVKIGDFSVSQVFEDKNDELRRSPGTPVFTAPECCLGLTIIFVLMLSKIVNNPLLLPDDMNPQLRDLLEGILCKGTVFCLPRFFVPWSENSPPRTLKAKPFLADPSQRMTLDAIAKHSWVIGDEGPIPQYQCWCKRKSEQSNLEPEENGSKYDDFDVGSRNSSS